MSGYQRNQAWPIVTVAVLIAAIAAIDFFTPLGVVAPVLYVVAVFWAARFVSPKSGFAVAAACTVLVIVGGIVSPPTGDPWKAHVNRDITMVLIWVMAVLLYKHSQTKGLLARKNDSLHLLQEITVAANEAPTIDGALLVAVEKICVAMGWPVGHVYFPSDRGARELYPSTIWYLKHPQLFETFRRITEQTDFAPGEGLPGRVWASGDPAWIVDVTKDANFPRARLAKDIGVKAGFGFPVSTDRQVVAVLEFFYVDAVEPDGPLLEIMAYIGSQLGQIIERKRAEKALRESVERFELAVRGTRDGLWDAWAVSEDLFNPQNPIYYSPRFKELLDFSDHEFPNIIHSWASRLHPDDSDRVFKALQDHVDRRAPYDIEYRMITKSGQCRWFAARGQAIWDEAGRPVRMSGSFSDITARKLAQEAMRQSELQYRLLYDDNPSMYFTVAHDGTVLSVNRYGAQELGYTVEDLVGRPVLDVFYEQDKPAVQKAFASFVENPGRVARWEFRKVCKDGRVIWVKETANTSRDADGNPVVMVVCEDITERKQAEELLLLQSTVLEKIAIGSELQEVLNTLCLMVERLAPDSFCTVMRVAESGDKLRLVAGPSLLPEMTEAFDGLMLGERSGSCGTAAYCGQPVIVEDTKTDERWEGIRDVAYRFNIGACWSIPICVESKAEGKKVFGTFAITHTEAKKPSGSQRSLLETASQLAGIAIQRQRAEQALRSSEQRYRSIFDHAAVGIAHVAPDGRFLQANPVMCKILGYTIEEMRQLKFSEVTYPDDREESVRQVGQLSAGRIDKIAMDKRYIGKCGAVVWGKVSVGMVKPAADNSKYFVAVIEDITEQKRAEKERDRFFSLSLDMLCIAGMDGYFKRFNPAFERTLGYAREELLSKKIIEFIHADDRDKTLKEIERVRRGEMVTDFDNRYVCKDGSVRWLSWQSVTDTDAGVVYAVARDITDRMRAHEQAQQHQAQAAHVARLTTAGELASGLAHELNQPLAAISNYVQACVADLQADGWDKQEMIDTMNRASGQCHRASKIIRRLRNFVSRRELHATAMNINDVVHEAVGLIDLDTRTRGVSVCLDLDRDIQPVVGDSIQIEQVILNLAKNSLDAMSEVSNRPHVLTINTAPFNSQGIRVTLTDTGQGLSKDRIDEIFKPFYTTKPDGMGMGLSISRSIIEAHGGKLSARSKTGGGAVFQFTLPTTTRRST